MRNHAAGRRGCGGCPAGQDNGVGGTTDGAGVVGFSLFAADLPGDVTMHLDLPTGYSGVTAVCWDDSGALVDYADTDTGITLVGVGSGADITCAHYASAAADGHGDDDDLAEVTRLPNTGTGSGEESSAGTVLGLLLLGGGMAAMGSIAGQRRRA